MVMGSPLYRPRRAIVASSPSRAGASFVRRAGITKAPAHCFGDRGTGASCVAKCWRSFAKRKASLIRVSVGGATVEHLSSGSSKGRAAAITPHRQNHTRAPKAADSHAPAARNGLMILCPNRSHAKADNAKASRVTPVTTSSHVVLDVGSNAARSSIIASNPAKHQCV
jgi:hypothetical protein